MEALGSSSSLTGVKLSRCSSANLDQLLLLDVSNPDFLNIDSAISVLESFGGTQIGALTQEPKGLSSWSNVNGVAVAAQSVEGARNSRFATDAFSTVNSPRIASSSAHVGRRSGDVDWRR